MNLQIHLVPDTLQRLAVGGKDGGVAARHVKVVDAAVDGGPDSGDDLFFRLCADDGGAHTDDAYLFPAVGQNAIFHRKPSFSCWRLQTRRSKAKIRSLNSPTDRSFSTSR